MKTEPNATANTDAQPGCFQRSVRMLRIARRTLKYFLVFLLGITILGGITVGVCELISKINRWLVPALWIVAVLTICGLCAWAEERNREENAEKDKAP